MEGLEPTQPVTVPDPKSGASQPIAPHPRCCQVSIKSLFHNVNLTSPDIFMFNLISKKGGGATGVRFPNVRMQI